MTPALGSAPNPSTPFWARAGAADSATQSAAARPTGIAILDVPRMAATSLGTSFAFTTSTAAWVPEVRGRPATPCHTGRVSRRERLTLLATILGSTIVFLDSTVVNVALPAIQEDLDTGLAGQQWIVEAYMLTLVSLLLVGGSLGDLYGRRRLFLLGLAGFAVTSVLCAVAPTDEA